MGGGWSEAFDRDTLATVLFETLFGHAWLWHLGLEAALLAVLLAWRGTGALVLVTLLAAAHAASLAWAGHAVMHPGAAPLAAQVLHLLAGGLWLGSLPALYHLLARAQSAPSPALDHAVRTLLPLYSRVGYAVVSVLVLSGIGNSIFLVGSTGALLATPYGRVLLVKIALVLGMIAVALDNRLSQTPQILDRHPASVASFARQVALEQGIGASDPRRGERVGPVAAGATAIARARAAAGGAWSRRPRRRYSRPMRRASRRRDGTE